MRSGSTIYKVGVLLAALFALPGCALHSLPVDGTTAALANALPIHLHVDLLDQQGNSLDDVQITIIRYQMNASPLFSGQWAVPREEAPVMASKVFDYKVMGSCALELIFSKAGYITERHTYAHVDQIQSSSMPLVGTGPASMPCENIDKNPPTRIVLEKAGGTSR